MSDSSGLEMQPSWTILLVTGTDWVRQTIAMKITAANETIVFRDIIPNVCYFLWIDSFTCFNWQQALSYILLTQAWKTMSLTMIFITDSVHWKWFIKKCKIQATTSSLHERHNYCNSLHLVRSYHIINSVCSLMETVNSFSLSYSSARASSLSYISSTRNCSFATSSRRR